MVVQGAVLVAGTTSDAGKSAVVAGICRWLHRRGVSVAPFKAQNMSNNSVVTPDGGEIGRAQAMQAFACGIAPSVDLNPVLLKPGGDRTSQVVVRGRADGQVSALSYRHRTAALSDVVADSLARLRARHDVVVCEGAGSPAEINLRATDLANMGFARRNDLPVLVVGDIDRGGVLAHLFGTLAVLDPADQALIAGFVINKFRGDPRLLEPGLDRLRELTGRPTLGVLPFAEGLWLDAEDSLSAVADGVLGRPAPPLGTQWLRVAVVRFPRISNATDAEALACEPGVAVRYVTEPSRLADSDVVVLPGTKATVSDLAWLRSSGMADAVRAHAASGRPVLGICGGYQMLGHTVADPDGAEARPRHLRRRAGAAGPGDRLRPGQAPRHPHRDGVGRDRHRLRDPPRPRRALRRPRPDRGGGQRPRQRPGHALARPRRERRFPTAATHPPRGRGRANRVPGGTGHVVRGRAHPAGGSAGRPGRTPPGHVVT